jgi:dGTPase
VTGGYGAQDTARWIPEPPKRARTSGRGPFERDRARVLHSAALRRLAAKTQVVEVGSGDFPRTRLTHSLECAQVGRELGASLGCDPDLVDAACLAHDLGHPPFGHNGEAALNELAAPCGGFEGNAQSLRLLTRLEAKVPGAGLNLTRAALDATLKYPWLAGGGQAKYGAYAADAEVFGWIREGAPPGVACLEAQVMDWADDVAYSVHDLEDGVHAGLIRIGTFDAAARADLVEVAASLYTDQGPAELAGVLDVLLELPSLRDLAGYDRSFASLAAAKRVTSELTGRFVGAAVAATRSAYGNDTLARYAADLAVPAQVVAECALLKAMAARYVMFRPEAKVRRNDQIRLLLELSEQLAARAPAGLDPAAGQAWCEARDDAGRLRVVIDQVARLTDRAAVAWHRALDT